MVDFNDLTILITGGTGSLGKALVTRLVETYPVKKVIVFSRDELKQSEMRWRFDADAEDSKVRFFIGDVRDPDRLRRAFEGVDVVIHAAAMKQVPACEYNPIEAVNTNVLGAKNVVDAAIDAGVHRVLGVSTDKAVNPVNLYGATKLVLEKLFIHANSYSGNSGPVFSCVRYGNVFGSRGSVVQAWKYQATRQLVVTDLESTRFVITLKQAVDFVLNSLDIMTGGEVFVPKLKACSVRELVAAFDEDGIYNVNISGMRPGEKMHETLISPDESHITHDIHHCYAIASPFSVLDYGKSNTPDKFLYRSDLVDRVSQQWLREQIKTL